MPFAVVSEVSRGMGVLDRGGDGSRGRGNFGGECGASHCHQWGLCGIVVIWGRELDGPRRWCIRWVHVSQGEGGLGFFSPLV